MAYCTSSDISAELKGVTLSTTTKVTTAQVTEFIVQADALINGKVGQRYATPITGSEALSIVKQISIALVLSRVRPIFEIKSPDDKTSQEPGKDDFKKAMSLLEEIVKGTLILSDATKAGSHEGVSSYNVDNDIEHTFHVGESEW